MRPEKGCAMHEMAPGTPARRGAQCQAQARRAAGGQAVRSTGHCALPFEAQSAHLSGTILPMFAPLSIRRMGGAASAREDAVHHRADWCRRRDAADLGLEVGCDGGFGLLLIAGGGWSRVTVSRPVIHLHLFSVTFGAPAWKAILPRPRPSPAPSNICARCSRRPTMSRIMSAPPASRQHPTKSSARLVDGALGAQPFAGLSRICPGSAAGGEDPRAAQLWPAGSRWCRLPGIRAAMHEESARPPAGRRPAQGKTLVRR